MSLGCKLGHKRRQIYVFIYLAYNPFTKRGMLSTIASLYDPLGFICPVVLESKVLLQGLTIDDRRDRTKKLLVQSQKYGLIGCHSFFGLMKANLFLVVLKVKTSEN